MKILFTAKGKDWESMIDSRFGRTEYFFIYETEADKVEIFDNRSISNEAHGAGPKTAQKMAEYQVDVLITGNGPGGNAATVIKEMGTKVLVGAGSMTVQAAYEAYKNGELKEI
ncbi:MAG: NifB/NifX family molybdenum-iron cluster-binding protein [Candidatus Cloacimonadales bacterium]